MVCHLSVVVGETRPLLLCLVNNISVISIIVLSRPIALTSPHLISPLSAPLGLRMIISSHASDSAITLIIACH